jgi:ribulose-bisphosphate carboxylase large chain
MSMLTLAKATRLIGMDQLHIGTVVGKMEGPMDEVVELNNAIESNFVKPDRHLGQEWFGVKPVFSVCSGGLHPGHVPSLVRVLGPDIVIQAGGGVHGHPRGTAYGAAALRQAIDAVMLGNHLSEYAKGHKELAEALKHWKGKSNK